MIGMKPQSTPKPDTDFPRFYIVLTILGKLMNQVLLERRIVNESIQKNRSPTEYQQHQQNPEKIFIVNPVCHLFAHLLSAA